MRLFSDDEDEICPEQTAASMPRATARAMSKTPNSHHRTVLPDRKPLPKSPALVVVVKSRSRAVETCWGGLVPGARVWDAKVPMEPTLAPAAIVVGALVLVLVVSAPGAMDTVPTYKFPTIAGCIWPNTLVMDVSRAMLTAADWRTPAIALRGIASDMCNRALIITLPGVRLTAPTFPCMSVTAVLLIPKEDAMSCANDTWRAVFSALEIAK